MLVRSKILMTIPDQDFKQIDRPNWDWAIDVDRPRWHDFIDENLRELWENLSWDCKIVAFYMAQKMCEIVK